MPERHQYPARAEPVLLLTEGPEENAWHRAASEPVRQIPFSLAAIAPAVFLVVGAVVPFELDEFAAIRQPSEPVRVVAPIVGEGIIVTDPTIPAELLPLDWYMQSNEPVRETLRPVDEGGMVLGFDPEPFAQDILTRWWRPASEPIFPVRPTVPEGIYARAPPDPEQFAPSFGWWREASEPVRTAPHVTREGAAFGPDPEDLPDQDVLSRWWRPASEPVREMPRAVDEGRVDRNIDPISKLDLDWHRRASEPVREIPRPLDEGSFVWQIADPESLIPSFGWWRPPSEPADAVPRPVAEGGTPLQVEILPSGVVPDFGWYREANQPSNPTRRAIDEGGIAWQIVDPEAFAPSFAWWRQPVQVPDSEPPREPGLFAANIDPISKLDLDWLRRPSEPVRFQPRAIDEGGAPPFLGAEIVVVTVEFSWWLQPTEPVRIAPPSPEGGPAFVRDVCIPPAAILALTNLTPNDVSLIRDEVEALDDTYIEATGDNVDVSLRASFPTPYQPVTEGADLQEFRISVQPSRTTGSGTPEVRIFLYEAGVQVGAALLTTTISAPVVLSGTWNAAALADLSGADVQIVVEGDAAGGGPNARSVDIGAVAWCQVLGETPNDWRRPASEPVRIPPHAIGPQPVFVRLPAVVTPDIGWLRPPSEPVRPIPPAAEGRIAIGLPDALIREHDFPDWWPQPSEPVRTQPRPVAEGGVVAGLPDSSLRNHRFPDWGPPANEPVRVSPRIVDEGGLSFIRDIPAVEPEIGWLVAPSEPVRLAPPPIFDLAPLILEIVPPPPSFGWWVAAAEPVRTKPPVEPGLIARNLLPILVSGLEWARLPEIPVLPAHNAAALFLRPVPVLGLPDIFAIPAPPWPRIVATRFRSEDPFVDPIRICFPENWPYDSQVMSRETGRVIADEPEPSSGGAADPAPDPEDGHSHRHEWNL